MYSISKISPNVNKECIMFNNNAAYERIHDSFTSNPSESYIVGKFNGNAPNLVLDKIND
jgi:hypothetical protein